ncbi:MAG TPA: DUF2752 domain-containing protein [Edaphocola sp.]|nr:DUF2752 domain-containing protein [Edaphocola sp.]
MAASKKTLKWALIIGLFGAFVIAYGFFNPYQYAFFPKCPFYALTGLKCPGCGSQRALHDLLNFDIRDAFTENQLMVLSIPYVLTGLIFDQANSGPNFLKWRQRLFGKTAIFIVLFIIIAFWILRNISW